jgi:hypothetical protein
MVNGKFLVSEGVEILNEAELEMIRSKTLIKTYWQLQRY